MANQNASTSRAKSKISRRSKVIERMALYFSIPIFLLSWELLSRSGVVNQLLFPAPTTVSMALYKWAKSGGLWIDLGMSVSRVVVGFISGAFVGCVVGILTGRYQLISNLLTPVFQLLRPIPPIAFVPIVILWFGLSEVGKYFLVFWGVFFTVWISAHLGVQRVNRNLIRAAQTLGTSERHMMWEILIPASLPFILVGLRTSISVSFYTLVAAELAGTFAGVAYRIDIAQQNLQMGQMMGGLIVLGCVSFIADKAFEIFAAKMVAWA